MDASEIDDHDRVPTSEEISNLYAVLAEVVHEEPGSTPAFLIARPGRGPLTGQDRLLSARLVRGARRSGVPVEPIHVATDDAIWAVTPDDLAA